MDVAPGSRLGGYRIVGPLGKPGRGHVYQARDLGHNRDVALKLLTEEPHQDRFAIERFVRDARAASALDHPNIVTVYDVAEADAHRFIVMELVRGQTLREAAGTLTLDSMVDIIGQIARALAAAHAAGLVHRDVKPENVMVCVDGSVKILDFGLARPVPAALLDLDVTTTATTAPGVILGTLRYMSPEQVRGEPSEAASDVFSLGVLFYELATGYHPFLADSPIGMLHAIRSRPPVSPSKLNPEVSAGREAVMLQMLEKDAMRRPSAAEVAARLEHSNERGASGSNRTSLHRS
jgi:serine/threonine protein kinase